MSKHRGLGFWDGFHRRPSRKPHELLDYVFAGPKTIRRYGQEDRAYNNGYSEGAKEHRRRSKY